MATTADTLTRTNEEPGTRAKLRNLRISAYKVREVLNLIRGKDVQSALDILQFCERGAAEPIQKLLESAIANATNNDGMDRDELFVSACFADEGVTMKRMKPRARGRSARIRKRGSHITIIVGRLPEDRLARLRAEREAQAPAGRRRRVAGSRAARVAAGRKGQEAVASEETTSEEVVEETQTTAEETAAEAPETDATAEETTTNEVAAEDATKSDAEGANDAKEEK